MTHILLVADAGFLITHWQQDPRPMRELVLAINTGLLRIVDELYDTPAPQSACAVPEHDTVVVTYAPPAVELTPRLYQTLWGLADGLSPAAMAQAMGITVRTLHLHYARLKERFSAQTLDQVLVLADEYGLL